MPRGGNATWNSVAGSNDAPSTTMNGASRNATASTNRAFGTSIGFHERLMRMPRRPRNHGNDGQIQQKHKRHQRRRKRRATRVVRVLNDHLLNEHGHSANTPTAQQHRRGEGSHAHVEGDKST